MKSVRSRLLASTLLVGMATLTSPAVAQIAPAEDAQNASTTGASSAAEQSPTDDIVVTGTLIRNPNLESSSPVASIGRDEVELQAANVAEELLRELPGAVPSIGSAVNNGNGGQSFVNLRGIGENRNIVLLDGNRIVPGSLDGLVDLNNIPLALIERTEVLTGGASTTYGADAISGVVNFITRQDFSGVEANISQGITERGDGNRLRADVTIGANFDDGRGNAVFSVGYQEVDPVFQGDRKISVLNVDTFSGAVGGGSGTSVPSTFTGTRPLTGGVPNRTPAFADTGATVTLDDGSIVPVLAPVPGGLANGGGRQINPTTGQAIAPYQAFNFNPDNIFQTPFERFNLFGQAKYEVSDGLEVYSRGLFSKQTVSTIVAPSGSFGSSITVPLSNPYLPAGLRNQICAFNIAPNVVGVDAAGEPVAGQIAYTPRFTQAQCDAAATATSPTLADGSANPAFRTATINLSRRAVEVGPRISNFTSTVFDYRVGIRGAITSNISFDVNGGYGESENIQTLSGYVLTSRLRSAVFATNTTSCLGGATGGADVAAGTGCVPVNVFGAQGSILPNQIPYLVGESTSAVRTSLGQARAVINGDFGFSSPFADDALGFAVGGEYREYKAAQRSDSLSQTPGELGGSGGAAPNIDGGYNVYEAFGELLLPLVQDRPFFKELTLEAGVRYSDYKIDAPTSPSFNTTTYKVGGQWEPGFGFKMRGNYSRAVRAPNIFELFNPLTTGLTSLNTDPCATLDGELAPNGRPVPTGTLRAICLAQGATVDNIVAINDPTAGQLNSTDGGNVNLRPEVATTYTFGAVFTPDFVPGLSIAVDYFNIKVKGAVSQLTPGDAITNCFGAAGANGSYSPAPGAELTDACTVIRRNPVTGSLDGDSATTPGLSRPLSNLGRIETDGIDVNLNYRRDLGFAGLNLGFIGTYTRNQKFQATPSSINRECVGYYSANCGSIQPKYQFSQRTTLTFEDVDVSLLWRYLDGVEQEPEDALRGNGPFYSGPVVGFGQQDLATIGSRHYFDLSTRFGVTETMALTLTVENLLDQDPPLTGAGSGAVTYNSGNTFPSTYDALGRRYTANVRLRF